MSDRSKASGPGPIAREGRVRLQLDPTASLQRLAFFGLDTDIQVTVRTRPAVARLAAAELIEQTCRYERLFSRFLPHSDISRLNGAQGKPVEVALETYELIGQALAYCAASEGTFDITVGPAARLWDFKAGRIPKVAALAEACRHVDWRAVEPVGRSGETGQVRLADPQALLDLGGIAKGYIANRLSETLAELGVASHLINLGGNTLAAGTRDGGRPWRVEAPSPNDPSGGIVIDARDCSVVTSGTYERSFMRDGILYHHVLDPRTGMPVATDLIGATVVARRSIDAEGFSTTLLALGSERAARFARERSEVLHALLLTADGWMRV